MNNIIRNIFTSLLSKIITGELKPGAPLPKEIEIAKMFETGRMNAHRAVKEMELRGLVTRKKRSGSFLKTDLNIAEIQMMLQEAGRRICVLYSLKPNWIHWNESSFAALENEIIPRGYKVEYKPIPSARSRSDYKKILSECNEEAAAIVIFPDSHDSDFLKNNSDLLLDMKIPVLMLNRSGEELPFDMVSFVSLDSFGDGVAVGTLLKNNNRTDIIMINEPTLSTFWGAKRNEGLQLGLTRGGKKNSKINYRQIKADPEGLAEAVSLIKKNPGKFVVVPVNNEYAANFINFAQKNGVAIPADYQLIAFDDNPLYRSYEITSIAAPVEEIGRTFGKLIAEHSWFNIHKGKISIKLHGSLVIRRTYNNFAAVLVTACPPDPQTVPDAPADCPLP